MPPFEHPIRKVAAFVLSEWAMMLVEPLNAQPQAAFNTAEPFFRVTAYYQGVFNGDLTIICQGGFLEALARNILGREPEEEVPSAERWDALKELANIISGNFLVEAYGEDTVFDLPSFELAETSYSGVENYLSEKMSKYLGEAVGFFQADEQPVFLCFDIHASEY